MTHNSISGAARKELWSRDFEQLRSYVQERYDIGITENHAAQIHFELELSRYPDVTLKEMLSRLGYLSPMFTGRDIEAEKVTWNELHLFGSPCPDVAEEIENDPSGYLDEPPPQELPRYHIEPNYARSRISRTLQRPKPVNKTAQRVSPGPSDDEWLESLEDA